MKCADPVNPVDLGVAEAMAGEMGVDEAIFRWEEWRQWRLESRK